MAKGGRLPAIEDHPAAPRPGTPRRSGRHRLEHWSRSRGTTGRDRLERVVAISWIQWSRSPGMRSFPCCVRFPCVHAAATTPVQRLGVLFAHSPSRISIPRKGRRVGLHIVLFEACSAFTRVAACTLARSLIRDPLSEGFSHFVTSMTAPVASGWSGCRVGLAPTGERRLITAHTRSGHRPRRAGRAHGERSQSSSERVEYNRILKPGLASAVLSTHLVQRFQRTVPM
jgi:hypothetical protein